jgi:hypothetical protein
MTRTLMAATGKSYIDGSSWEQKHEKAPAGNSCAGQEELYEWHR